jgi:hypothetical protein
VAAHTILFVTLQYSFHDKGRDKEMIGEKRKECIGELRALSFMEVNGLLLPRYPYKLFLDNIDGMKTFMRRYFKEFDYDR